MKRIRHAAWLLMAVCATACPTLYGQTFYDFAYGSIGGASRSIIRSHGVRDAVAYFEQGDDHFLALVNPTDSVHMALLNPRYTVSDIRVVGDEAYFCGRCGNRGGIGKAVISSLRSSRPDVTYFALDTGKVSELTRMVAYPYGGVTKVAAIGMYYYSPRDTVDDIFKPCPAGYTCKASVVVECDFFGGGIGRSNMLVVNPEGHVEIAFDIVETDNHVAVVTHYTNNDQTAIHRCDKANVLGSFTNMARYYNSSTYSEGLAGYAACKTEGDTIAVACAATATGSLPCETHLSLFDLQSMAMTRFQRFVIPDKCSLSEMVYMPRHATLVMLQYQPFPSAAYRTSFIFWKPYETSAYTAKVMLVEHRRRGYGSLDRLTEKHFIATGGGHWFMKDAMCNNPSSS